MAFMTLTMKNPHNGKIREAPIGFSWTVLFFGCLPALFRSDWKGFVIMLILALFTFGLSGLVFAFIYNSMHAKALINDGYRAAGDAISIERAEAKIGRQIPIFAS